MHRASGTTAGAGVAAAILERTGRSVEEIQERWVVGGDRMLEEEAAA